MLLTNPKFMLKQLRDVEANIRGTLPNFGLKVGQFSRSPNQGLHADYPLKIPRSSPRANLTYAIFLWSRSTKIRPRLCLLNKL